jgi:hypothetical protein
MIVYTIIFGKMVKVQSDPDTFTATKKDMRWLEAV